MKAVNLVEELKEDLSRCFACTERQMIYSLPVCGPTGRRTVQDFGAVLAGSSAASAWVRKPRENGPFAAGYRFDHVSDHALNFDGDWNDYDVCQFD